MNNYKSEEVVKHRKRLNLKQPKLHVSSTQAQAMNHSTLAQSGMGNNRQLQIASLYSIYSLIKLHSLTQSLTC
jgi:hypothetical protein